MADATRMLWALHGRRRISLDQLKKLDATPKPKDGNDVPASTGRPSKSRGKLLRGDGRPES
jgi:hypothetical protein